MASEERKHQSFAAREESAKRQKRLSLTEDDEVDSEAENGDSNSSGSRTKLCKECEEELGEEDNNGQGFTCNCCFGGCDLKQMCHDCCSDMGFVCSTCEECYSHDCADETEHAQFICDDCLNIYCKECSDPKPGKNGTTANLGGKETNLQMHFASAVVLSDQMLQYVRSVMNEFVSNAHILLVMNVNIQNSSARRLEDLILWLFFARNVVSVHV